ncbi:MAG: hypothetical protein U1F67_23600 [Rubrivivax sp.]
MSWQPRHTWSLAALWLAEGGASWNRCARRNFWLPLLASSSRMCGSWQLAHCTWPAALAPVGSSGKSGLKPGARTPMMVLGGVLPAGQRCCASGARSSPSRVASAALKVIEIGWSLRRSVRRLRVKPLAVPSPAGIVPPAPVPCIAIVALVRPPSTLTLPMASVPSWHERHSLLLPPGVLFRPSVMCCASSVLLV